MHALDRRLRCCLLAALILSGAAAARPQPADGTRVPAEADSTGAAPAASVRKPAYAGLRLRQSPEGVVVVGVQPGPLAGDGFKSATIWRGDLIAAMNDIASDAAGYMRLIRSLTAGDMLRITYRRSRSPDPFAGLPVGDPEGEARTVDIVLDDADRWTGSIGRGLTAGRAFEPAAAGDLEAPIMTRARALAPADAPDGVDGLVASLAALQRRLLDPNALPLAVQALERPLSLDRVEADLAEQVRRLAVAQPLPHVLSDVHRFLLRTLDLSDAPAPEHALDGLRAARDASMPLAVSLLADLAADRALTSPDFPRYLQLMRNAREWMPLAVAALPRVARHAQSLEEFAQAAGASTQPLSDDLAERVRAAVLGPVLGARLVDGELWVVGGAGANGYDMGRIAAVFDVGGDDTYRFPAAAPGPYQIVIDEAGDDRYEAGADAAGPAAAVLSVAVLEDRAGDDRYRSGHRGAMAAAAFGVALLIDASGDDEYVNDGGSAGWAQGSGVYGAGLLIDRTGDDRYDGQILAQGVGGPGGIGLLLDAAGDDAYTANGPHFASGYATPGVFAGLSQGFGTGLRGYAAGGIGALYDLAGDDRYTVGEFGQGTGYFQGLGVLHDGAGDDVYAGSRYAQGSAAHQAAGILVDHAGDDDYSCAGPAAQGAAWDQSTALLLDRAGNDSYRAKALAQAAAAQEAVAVLADLDGDDFYACTDACQGESGGNDYHYDASRLFNFGALLDRGARADTYSRPRANGTSLRTGKPARGAACCGLFLDE